MNVLELVDPFAQVMGLARGSKRDHVDADNWNILHQSLFPNAVAPVDVVVLAGDGHTTLSYFLAREMLIAKKPVEFYEVGEAKARLQLQKHDDVDLRLLYDFLYRTKENSGAYQSVIKALAESEIPLTAFLDNYQKAVSDNYHQGQDDSIAQQLNKAVKRASSTLYVCDDMISAKHYYNLGGPRIIVSGLRKRPQGGVVFSTQAYGPGLKNETHIFSVAKATGAISEIHPGK